MRLLARNQGRCRDHRVRPGQRAHLDRQARKARLGYKAPLGRLGPWARKENQAKRAPVVQLVLKERSDQPVDEGKVVLLDLGEKLVLRAPSDLLAPKANKASKVKKVR